MNCFDKSQYIELNIKINSREDVSSLESLLYDHFGLNSGVKKFCVKSLF